MKGKKIVCLVLALIFALSTSCFFTFAEEDAVSLEEYFTMVINDVYPDIADLVLNYIDFGQLEAEGYTDFGIFQATSSYVSFKFSKGEDFIFKNRHFSFCDLYDFTVSYLSRPPVINSQSCIYCDPSVLKFTFSTVPFYIDNELSLSGVSYGEYIQSNHPELVTTSHPSVMGSIGNCLSSARDNFITPIAGEFFTDNVFSMLAGLIFVASMILIILGAFKRGRG